jgi:hypothetical protein
VTDERSTKIMTAIFRDRDAAERAYGALMNRGYKSKDVTLLMSNETRERCFPRTERETTELGSKAKEGAGIGAVAGGGLGALLAGMAASGIAVPLLPIIAIGPLAAALGGAATGGTLGAVVGALVGAGIPEERAKLYDTGIKEGGIVIGVTPLRDDDTGYLEDEWTKAGGNQIYRPDAEPIRRDR